jgi:tetratricopeptide (TPR) repeat protein
MHLNRHAEGVALMEASAPGEPDPAADWKNVALQHLFMFYAFKSQDIRLPESMRTTAKTHEACRRAMQIFDRILISAVGKRDREAQTWAHLFVPNLADRLMWVDEQGYIQLYLSPAERADAMRRALEVFGWDPVAAARGNLSLGASSEEARLWEQALTGYRGFLDASPKMEGIHSGHQGEIPSRRDSMALQPSTWIDEKIEAYYRLAKIRHDGLQQRDAAVRAYQEMVSQVGLANFRGPNAIASMADLNARPEYPDKSALIWGWDSNGQRSWERVLAPLGYKVHSLRTSLVTSAQLGSYSLIVLVRAGTMVLTPSEILALRSYVAAGGSLLVVVSPGWEPAAPSIHNGLLRFFDVEVGRALPCRVNATRIVAHPITKGVSATMVKCGTALRAPSEATLISAGDDGLLAAKEYRFGRVVVAGFGQWFLPDPTIFPGGWQNYRGGHWTAQTPLADLPFETGADLCRPLLENVIGWLSGRPQRTPDFIRWKGELAAAHWTESRVHARNLDWEAMAEPHEKLIAAAFDPLTREESLWTAGESYFNLRCFTGTQFLVDSQYGFDMNTRHDPEPRHYEQLIKSFPDSQLYHYAQWRLAECQRLQKLFRIGMQRGLRDSPELISSFDSVSASPGTHPWAWARLRQGALAVSANDWSKAIELLKQVVDSMPHGPERTIALAMAGDCLVKAGQVPEARRTFEELNSLPVMSWSRIPDWLSQWYPVTSDYSSSRQISIDNLNRLGRQ